MQFRRLALLLLIPAGLVLAACTSTINVSPPAASTPAASPPAEIEPGAVMGMMGQAGMDHDALVDMMGTMKQGAINHANMMAMMNMMQRHGMDHEAMMGMMQRHGIDHEAMMGMMDMMDQEKLGHDAMMNMMAQTDIDPAAMMDMMQKHMSDHDAMMDMMAQEMNPATEEGDGMDPVQAADPSLPFDAQFIDSMIVHHQGAVDMAQLALKQADHEEMRVMAASIIETQQAEIGQMQAWRAAWHPDVPPTTGMGMHMGDMAITDDPAIPFDQRFLEAMISHHRGAIAMAMEAQTQTEHDDLKQLADAIITAQESEIAQMEQWLADWYGVAATRTSPSPLAMGTIWVANEMGDSLTVVDAMSYSVVATLTGIRRPHNVQASPDGSTIWAVSGRDAMVVALDARNYTVLGTAPVGNSPAHVIVSPDNKWVYVSNSGDDSVTVLDAATFAVRATIPVGDFPHGLRPSPDGQLVAVANLSSGTISLIDAASFSPIAEIPVGAQPVQVAFAPDGETLYVSLNGEDTVAAVNVATQTVVGKAKVGDGPVQVFATPDGSSLVVANQGVEESPGVTISLVNSRNLTEIAKVDTGQGAHGVAIEPSGRYAYVTNLYDDTLSVIDLTALATVATVSTGASPNGVSFSPVTASAPEAAEISLIVPVPERADEPAAAEGHDIHH